MKKMLKIELLRFDKGDDIQSLHGLWVSTLGTNWPIGKDVFENLILDSRYKKLTSILVARIDKKIVGVAVFQEREDKILAEIMLILVYKDYQREGVGRKLLESVVQKLKADKIKKVQLGGGGYSYFWPGVPSNLPNVSNFFKKNDWEFTETCVDMVLDLSDYKTPNLYDNKLPKNIKIVSASILSKDEILTFEKNNFPNWFNYFEKEIERKHFDKIILAKENNRIVGTTLISEDKKWDKILSSPIGTIGAIGVEEKNRGRGIGSAMMSYSLEKLKQEKFKTVYLGWTYLKDWYEKLGFKMWRKYHMAWKDI